MGNDIRQFWNLVNSMNTIGWRRFVEGMLSEEVLSIQGEYLSGGMIIEHSGPPK